MTFAAILDELEIARRHAQAARVRNSDLHLVNAIEATLRALARIAAKLAEMESERREATYAGVDK